MRARKPRKACIQALDQYRSGPPTGRADRWSGASGSGRSLQAASQQAARVAGSDHQRPLTGQRSGGYRTGGHCGQRRMAQVATDAQMRGLPRTRIVYRRGRFVSRPAVGRIAVTGHGSGFGLGVEARKRGRDGHAGCRPAAKGQQGHQQDDEPETTHGLESRAESGREAPNSRTWAVWLALALPEARDAPGYAGYRSASPLGFSGMRALGARRCHRKANSRACRSARWALSAAPPWPPSMFS